MSSMDASWLIDHLANAALRALVPAAAAALFLAAFRVRHAALRLAVWTGVLYASLAMPFLGALLPPIPVRVPARLLAATGLASRKAGGFRAPIAAVSQRGTPRSLQINSRPVAFRAPTRLLMPTRAAVPAESRLAIWRARIASLTASEIVLGIYLLVMVVLLARLGTGLILSRRLRRSAQPIDDAGARRWLKWHALAMGVDRAPLLMESQNVSVPLTLGVWRPIILLPVDWREWESGKLSAVIAHELSHVSRNDSRTKALSVAYRTFFWFSPLSWWLESHLAALGEQASDLAAIGAGAEPGYYAEVLMSFFRAIQNNGARVCRQGVAMARSRLGARANCAQDRIEKILSANGMLAGKPKARMLAALALIAVPLLYLSAATRPVLVASPASPAAAQQWPAPPPAPAAPAIAPVAPAAPAVPAGRLTPVARTIAVPPAVPYAAVAPVAPIPPRAWSQQPEPPEPPEPPQVRDDDDWTINNIHEGMDFAIVHGKSVMMNGSGDDQDEVRDLQRKIGGDFIWFIHAGNSYVIRDSGTVQHALQLYAPMEELGRQQDELGRQQEALGRKQEALGKQQDEVRVKVPAELTARLKRVEDEIRQLGPDASQEDLGRLQGKLGDIQGYIGDLQGKAGDAQGELGRKQGELGAQQGELGRKQGELGRRQGEIAREAAHKMQGIIEQALSSGKAQRAPQ